METKFKLGWKVVEKYKGKFYSSHHYSGFFKKEYKINKWVAPVKKCGPLCVFETRKAARKFAYLYDNFVLFRCKYIPSNKNKIWDRRGAIKLIDTLPEGKALASKVMLLYKAR